MTVRELKAILARYPNDMHVVTQLCSDTCPLSAPSTIEVIYNASNAHYRMYYKSQHDTPPPNLMTVLYFEGN